MLLLYYRLALPGVKLNDTAVARWELFKTDQGELSLNSLRSSCLAKLDLQLYLCNKSVQEDGLMLRSFGLLTHQALSNKPHGCGWGLCSQDLMFPRLKPQHARCENK